MRIFVKKIALFFLVFSLFLILYGYYLEYRFSRDLGNKFTWQSSIENSHFDYAFLGNSRSYNMVDINTIDDSLATRGVNLGFGGTDFRTLYMTIYSFIELQNNRVDQIFLQVDPFMFYDDNVHSTPNYDYYFYRASGDEEIRNSLKSRHVWIYDLFPIIKYVKYNSIYNVFKFARSFKSSTRWDRTKGSALLDADLPFHFDERDKSEVYTDFTEEDSTYFIKILEFLDRKHIQTSLFTAPVYAFGEEFASQYPHFETDLKKVTDRYQIPYISYIHALEDEEQYFQNLTHLNGNGSVAFSRLLLESRHIKIKENDHKLTSEERLLQQ